MKKQSTFHRSNRIRETETPTTQFPIQTPTESRPQGLHTRSKTHIDTGAAETRVKPVLDKSLDPRKRH